MKLSGISDLYMEIVDLSGSSYVILYDTSAPYSLEPRENDFLMSDSSY